MPDLKTGALLAADNEFQPGVKMPDGTIFAGISPDSRGPMYVLPADANIFTWKNAVLHAAKLEELGHRDWRVPTLNELDVLFQNRALIGGFSMTGWYCSSLLSSHGLAWVQRFSDGHQFSYSQNTDNLLLRCVRG